MFFSPMLQCSYCDLIFQQPSDCHFNGDVYEVCPRCGAESLDWDQVGDDVINTLFYQIIGENFSEVRRINLRSIAEGQMEPFNPLTRKL